MATRYQLRRQLGEGGHGEVWEAEDRLTRESVAVKLIHNAVQIEAARVRREVLALRLLRLPGVVRLLDEGVDGGRVFLVMERVVGEPFPGEGRRGRWPAIAEVTVSLLETLSRIHGEGIIHRDVKPENVLVRADGRPVVLDFGISSGRRLGETLAEEEGILGTRGYLAPEQLANGQVSQQTDLYALGVLLYEALTGKLPHETKHGQVVLSARARQPPLPIQSFAPDVPDEVAGLVHLLLATDPDDRPRSAEEVLGMLRGQPIAHVPGSTLRRLDGGAPVDALLCAARARRAVDLVGPGSSGRTRCLQDVAARLQDEGASVAWAAPGWRAFSSLQPAIGGIDDRSMHLPDVVAMVDERLRVALAGGLVLLVDDAERLDRLSAAAIERARPAGAILRARREPQGGPAEGDAHAVRLEPLRREALLALFAGPERILHLPSDAAEILWTRTAGVQGRIAEEITAWVRAGLARWEGDLLAVDRDALDRLRSGLRVVPIPRGERGHTAPDAVLPSHLDDLLAWVSIAGPTATPELLGAAMGSPVWRVEADLDELEQLGAVWRSPDGRIEPRAARSADDAWSPERWRAAHAAIGQALPPGAPGRLYHLSAGAGEDGAVGEDALEIAREAETLGRRLAEEGRLGDATAALREGLLVVRRGLDPTDPERIAREDRLLALWVEVALAERTPPSYDRVLYELSRVEERTETTDRLEQVMRAAVAHCAGGDRALTLLGEVPPFEQPELERHRQALRVLVARCSTLAAEEAAVAEVAAWAAGADGAEAQATFAGCLGRLRYRQGRFDEAARHHAEAADLEPWATARIAAHLNAASALMEAFRHAEAAECAAVALGQARRARNVFYESRAEWILRSTAYRAGTATTPDEELLEAVDDLGAPGVEASIHLTEAAIAYRAGARDRAAALARRAAALWKSVHYTGPELLARCLALAAGAAPQATGEAQGLAARALECALPGIGLQALALLALARGEPLVSWSRAALPLTTGIPARFWHLRMDVLSVDEALDALRAGPAPAPDA